MSDKMLFYPWSVSDEARVEFEAELSSNEFLDLPTYLTEELEWQVFRMEDGFVRRVVLKDTGETKNVDSIVYSNFSVKPLSSEAIRDILVYLRRLASTDHFAGVVYRKALEQGGRSDITVRSCSFRIRKGQGHVPAKGKSSCRIRKVGACK